MNIREESVDGTALVRLSGRLDAATGPLVQEHLETIVERGAGIVVIDFNEVDFIASAGLRVLITTAKRLRPKGSLRLFGLNPAVRNVFEVSGVLVILAVFENEATALAG